MKRVKKGKNGNSGFSLVEVLLAIVILGLIATPILQIFITSAQINQQSKKMMAATDLAAMTLEQITSLNIDGTGAAREFFTSSGLVERIPGYTATTFNLNSTYASLSGFKSSTTASADNSGNKVVYYAGTTEGSTFGLMMNQVVYNGYAFDILVWCEPPSSAGTYYAYDVVVEVYAIEGSIVDDGSGGTYIDYNHYDECLATVEGAVANKR